ncbi:MAG TPA: MFS transporter [Verrucomicrobiae bacterium]|jgi:MFS family permease|nr:MFS transporter [Verrucomicrobiae bacterium]
MNIPIPTKTEPAPARPDTLRSSLRALPRAAWILFFGTFLNKFGGFVIPFLTLYLTGRGYSVKQAGLAVSAYGVGNLGASLLGGHLADQLGRRKTIVFSMFSGAATMMLLSQAHSFGAIVPLVVLTGLANEFYRPASQALLADIVPTEQRTTAFAALRVSFNAGFAFGPATAGLLAAYGYFWLFAGDAATSVLFGMVALFALPHGTSSTQNNASWAEALHVLRHDRKLHQLLLANFAIALVFFQLGSVFGLQVTGLGFSPAAYGAIVSFNGALIVFCELPLTRLTRKFPARRVMATGYLLCAAGFALNAFAHTIPALVLCMLVFTIGEMITMPTAVAYLADLAPSHMRGRYMGFSGLTWSMALIIGPAGGLRLFAVAPAAYWITSAAVGVFAAVVISTPPRAGSSEIKDHA